MTAEASECNGGCEATKVEFEGKGAVGLASSEEGDQKDLKKGGDGGIACGEGEEHEGERIGGSFVIVNGDSDDSSEKDLDLDQKVDLAMNAGSPEGEQAAGDGGADGEKENIELRSENGHEIRKEEEVERLELSEEKGGSGELSVENEDGINEEPCGENGENGELCSNIDVNGEEGKETAVEVEEKHGAVTVENEREELEAASEIEEEKEGKVVATETDHHEKLVSVVGREDGTEVKVTATDHQEELGSAVKIEEEEEEAEIVVNETDHHEEVGSAAKVEEEKEAGAAVTETDHHEESGSAVIEEEQKGEILVAEAEEKQESQPEVHVVETNQHVQLASGVKAGDAEEPQSVVTENNESETVVPVEENQEPNPMVTEICDDKRDLDSVAVEKKQEPEAAVEETGNPVELESAVEAELQQEPVTVVAEVNVVVEEKEEPKAVVTEVAASEFTSVENEDVEVLNVAADISTEKPSGQIEITSEMKHEIISESDKKKSSENVEASSIFDANGVDSTAEASGDSLEYNLQSQDEDGHTLLESSESPSVSHNDKQVELEATSGSTGNGEKAPSEPEIDVPTEANETRSSDPVKDLDQESGPVSASDGIEVKSYSPESGETKQLSSNNDSVLETKVGEDIVVTDKDVAIDHVGMKLESESGNESTEGGECIASSVEGDRSTNKDDDEEPTHEQAEASEGNQATLEDPCSSALDGDKVETHVVKWHAIYMIRVPRFTDDELQKKIQHAQSLVEEKTRNRDTIRDDIQKKRATCSQYREELEVARTEERAARAAVSTKRQELDSVQSAINNMKNATSIADIDDKIRDMVHKQQHETISLKQEKQYIHEINQLKHYREQLYSKQAPQAQIDEALDQKEQIEARFKTLKKELDSLRTAVSQAEINAKAAKKRFDDEVQLIKNLQEQFKIADDLRQEAYSNLRKLKNESYEKTKHFYRYRDDQKAATNYKNSGDNEGLRSHCKEQVERIMDQWNNNEEFRKQYVKYNTNSTLRRLKTLDGRSLGPDEEPPVIHTFIDKKSSSIDLPSSKIESPVLALEVKQESLAVPVAIRQVPQSNHSAKLKSSTKPTTTPTPTPREVVMATVSNSQESVEGEKEKKLTKEEEEQARKAEELAQKEEELRKEKEAAELKERLRLEQKAKAKEAEERKRRKAEKALAKAQYKAQKEAELREKKRAKKERKNAGIPDAANGGEGDAAPVTEMIPPETSTEPEVSATAASRRRSTRPVAARQYNKVQPLPLPLRNRGKRKLQPWMWGALITVIGVIVFFLAANSIRFSLAANSIRFS